jgi:uncharacterized protein (UPF0264 family)
MTGMLASVSNLAEAEQALRAGVDIIDLKAPAAGALGALSTQAVCGIVEKLKGQRPLSATIGDMPMQPPAVLESIMEMAETGVDYVKVGFFPGGEWLRTIHITGSACEGTQLIAVLFADQALNLEYIAKLAAAGYSGVMLDTLDKEAGSLLEVSPWPVLEDFVAKAHAYKMLCGLAGSLRAADVPRLLELSPDYLGFRGALCRGNERTGQLDPAAIDTLRALIH